MIRPLAFVVSHPFARKKAKGWGTEFVQDQAVRDLAVRDLVDIELHSRVAQEAELSRVADETGRSADGLARDWT